MLRFTQALIRMSSTPRGGRGAGRSSRRNHARPYHANAPRNAPAATAKLAETPAPAAANIPATDDSRRHFSNQTFANAPISTQSKSAIKHMYLSDVQAATLELGLAGKDLLVQAKTGTGKTMAFLLPTVERLAKLGIKPRQGDISVLILSPTRELALQIEDEAKVLLKNHPFVVQHAIGGTNMNAETKRFNEGSCDILIATPGRLLDHLQNGTLKPKFAKLKSLILDEADRLLDQGFMRDLEKIFALLPDRNQVPRQAMLFSATMSNQVKQVVGKALNADHIFVSTLTEEEANTHEHVPQTVITAPLSQSLATTLAVLREDQATHGHASKVMVFFPTARATGLAAEVFRNIPGLPPVVEIHSRKSQPQRTKAAETFKDAKGAILLSSDVAARGMDFPGVTLVVQTGIPSSAEQYIHRLGRTARAGASGRGVLILAPFEQFFMSQKDVQALPINPHPAFSSIPSQEITNALQKIDSTTKAQTYQAWLGYYNVFMRRMGVTPDQFVEMANTYVMEVLGYKGNKPPPIMAKTIGNMGLKGARGFNVVRSKEQLVHPA